jgi:hypothetical protein
VWDLLAEEEIALTKPLHGREATVNPNAVRAQRLATAPDGFRPNTELV